MMTKKVLGGAVVLLFVALLGYRVAAARNDMQARAEDRAQIENLMWKYSHALSTLDADAYAALYAPDGQKGTGANAIKGRDALKKMMSDLKEREAGQRPVYVMDLNSYVVFPDRNHAHMEGYWLEVSPRAGPNAAAQVVNAGREVNEFERINGRWYIQLRNDTPQDDTPQD